MGMNELEKFQTLPFVSNFLSACYDRQTCQNIKQALLLEMDYNMMFIKSK